MPVKKPPKVIKPEDQIGRSVFSSNQAERATKGSIDYRIFFYKISNNISVDRFGFCSDKKLTAIQCKNAKLRSEEGDKQRSFYGWVTLKALDVLKKERKVKPTPTKDNPYHADIMLPKNIERDDKILHTKELATHSKWKAKF